MEEYDRAQWSELTLPLMGCNKHRDVPPESSLRSEGWISTAKVGWKKSFHPPAHPVSRGPLIQWPLAPVLGNSEGPLQLHNSLRGWPSLMLRLHHSPASLCAESIFCPSCSHWGSQEYFLMKFFPISAPLRACFLENQTCYIKQTDLMCLWIYCTQKGSH